MSEESQILVASGSGIQTVVPQLATPTQQIVYLDFDGADTAYYNRDLDIFIDTIIVEDSGFDSTDISFIVDTLNAQFDNDIVFTAELPQTDEYSTIYVGVTSAFDAYGAFLGLAETIDSGNQIHDDNAFVLLNSAASVEFVTSVIAHETEHIVQGMEHEGEDLGKYAATSVISSGQTVNELIVSSGNAITVWGTVNGATVKKGLLAVSSGGILASTTVFASGSVKIDNGAYATSTLLSTGKMLVYSGGIASTVRVSGVLSVYSGGTAMDIRWTPCRGVIHIEHGANVTFLSSYSGLYYTDTYGNLCSAMSKATWSNHFDLNVMDGGVANYYRIYDRAVIWRCCKFNDDLFSCIC